MHPSVKLGNPGDSMTIRYLCVTVLMFMMHGPAHCKPPLEPRTSLETAQRFLSKHCIDCHDSDISKQDRINLETLGAVQAKNADRWQRILTQLATGEMPPRDEAHPELAAREGMIDWITRSLQAAGHKPRLPGGPLPADGNLTDHERLFSGYHKGPAYSPPRFWRRSQRQYDSLMEQLWVIPKFRYEKSHQRNDPQWAGFGSTLR